MKEFYKIKICTMFTCLLATNMILCSTENVFFLLFFYNEYSLLLEKNVILISSLIRIEFHWSFYSLDFSYEIFHFAHLRFYLIYCGEVGKDLKFDADGITTIRDSELADTFGNLVHRATGLCVKYCHVLD
jgi:hypothetical protein